MLDTSLGLTPEQVNEFLTRAILDSELGTAVREATTRVLADLRRTTGNPFDTVIKKHVEAMIDKEIMITYRDELETKVREGLARQLTDELINGIVQAALERFRRNF